MKLNLRFLKVLFTGILFITTAATFAQHTVTGTVKDMDGNTLPGVNVTIKGTTVGTITDVEGQYKLDVPGNDAMLVFSFIGYSKEEIVVGDQKKIDVTLLPDVEALSEVIVIGYGTMKKEDKTGAVAQVTADEMQGGILTDAVQAIQGRSAGVMVSKQGGDPNSGFAIRVRGASSFSSDTQPLYVVDGVPGVDPTTVAPEDIKTFDILKDAASTAIYGSQGANGVIIITTKKGKGSKGDGFISNVNFNSKMSLDFVAKRYDLLSANDIRSYAQKLAEEQGQSVDSIFNDGGANTDWQDEIFRMGVTYSNNVSFSGGNDKSSYYASVTNANWEGVMLGTSKERTIGKINVNHSGLDGRLTMTGGLSGTFEENDYESYGGFGQSDIIYQALTRNPTDPVYNPDGSYYQSTRVFNYENPIAVINEIDDHRTAKRFMGNMKTSLEIIEGLTGSVSIAYTRDDNVNSYFRPDNVFATPLYGHGSKTYNNNAKKIIESTITYEKQFGLHKLNLLGGHSWQENIYDGFNANASYPSSNSIGYDNLNQFLEVTNSSVSSYKGMSKLIGFFSRAQYNYNEKYYISGSFRYDGSSRFGSNNRWGAFPTAAIGWKLNRESFLENVSWIDLLKARISYGVAGNQNFGDYYSTAPYEPNGVTTDPETNEDVIVYQQNWVANPFLKWERTSELNGGIDYSFFDGKLSGSLDIYEKTTDQLLGKFNVPVPPNKIPWQWGNSGKFRSRGIELYVQYFAVDRPNFKWKTTANVSHNNTIVVSLGKHGGDTDFRNELYISGRGLISDNIYTQRIEVGQELGSFYLPTYVTIIDGQFVYESESGGYTTELGDAKRKFMGSASPDIELGWSNSLTIYDNWYVDISFRAWIGNKMYNATEMFFDNPNLLPNLNAYSSAIDWHNEGRTSGQQIADIYLEDASFLRLDYISIGYQFRMEKVDWIKNLKLFIASNNLFTITGYSGIDPETTINGTAFGLDQYNVYPKTRTVSFGINATF